MNVKKDRKNPIRIIKTVITIILVIGIIGTVVTGGFYTVDEQNQAVVTTFGKVTSVQGAGPHFKFPIIQKAIKVPVSITQ